MDKVRIGIIGVGSMGAPHARKISDGSVPRAKLAAVCDPKTEAMAEFSGVAHFANSDELIESGTVDAVVIATPHFDHVPIGIKALQHGLHTLVEKPIAVHKADAERLIAAHQGGRQVFAAMFNQRTDPRYKKLRELISGGHFGRINRLNWIITTWFRSEAYYASGGWRATWSGEGGGVLLNQCPHQIDLWQWLFGKPDRIRAFCQIGRFHNIEVEDDVTAYFEYANGTTGVFITTTGEAPGTNRLELATEKGKVLVEGHTDHILWIRNEQDISEFSRTTPGRFSQPGTWEIKIPIHGSAGQHVEVLTNFVDAILDGKELIAPAAEGLHSVEMANAMLYSSFMDKTIDLPLDAAAYEAKLRELIASSSFEKKTSQTPVTDDFSKSFS